MQARFPDMVYARRKKNSATAAKEIKELHEKRQPVLVDSLCRKSLKGSKIGQDGLPPRS